MRPHIRATIECAHARKHTHRDSSHIWTTSPPPPPPPPPTSTMCTHRDKAFMIEAFHIGINHRHSHRSHRTAKHAAQRNASPSPSFDERPSVNARVNVCATSSLRLPKPHTHALKIFYISLHARSESPPHTKPFGQAALPIGQHHDAALQLI